MYFTMSNSDESETTNHHITQWRGGLAGYSPHAFAHHVTARLVIERGLARTASELRLAASTLFRHGEARGLVLFRFADTHLHLILASDRRVTGMFARVAECALRKLLRIPIAFEGARIRPIESIRHAFNAFRYGFTQEAHHGTSFDEAHDGSSLPELLGMRIRRSGIVERVRSLLPRLKRENLLEWLGTKVIDDEAAPMEPSLLRDAACAAFGVASLVGRTLEHGLARRAAVELCSRVAPTISPGTLLELPARTIYRCRFDVPTAAEVIAVEKQLRLRTWLLRRPR
jgi:hypothetical protein